MPTTRDTSLANEPAYSSEFAKGALERYDTFLAALSGSHRFSRIRRSVEAYYSESEGQDDTTVQSGGSHGQATIIRPNQFRSLNQVVLNLVVQAPPRFEAIAKNSDAASLAQVGLAAGILEHYGHHARLDALRVRRAEIAIICGESWLHAPWDPSKGKPYASDGEREVNEGDLNFEVLPPWQVAYDWLSPDLSRPREVIMRVARNRWDLAAQFPQHRDAILRAEDFAQGHVDLRTRFGDSTTAEDYAGVYFYYAERTADCPQGREALILDHETVLSDGPLSDARIPAFRLAPCERMIGAGGHSNSWDLLPLLEAYQAQVSSILSNHTTFGMQYVAIPRGGSVQPHHLAEGLTGIIYDAGPDGRTPPPAPLNLVQTPSEVFEFAELLRAEMERLMAISAVNRGDVGASKGDSGSKSALLASSAQQFATSFFQALARSDEDLGGHIVESLRRHASTSRVVYITGKSTSYVATEFTSDDLAECGPIIVPSSTPFRDTVAGRMETADKLVKLGDIKTGAQYMSMVSTGRYEPITEGPQAEDDLIRRENEDLRDPQAPPPRVAPVDNHAAHIEKHKSVLASPDVRRDEQLARRVIEHIQWHVDSLTPTSPSYAGDSLLLVTGQKPLPPPGSNPAMQGGPPPGGPSGPPPSGGPPGPPGPPPPNPNAPPPPPGMPPLPSMPVNPATGEPAPGPAPGEPPVAA